MFKNNILLTKFKGYKQMSYFCLMQFLQQLFNFYINASIHVALAVFSLVKVTELYFDLPCSESLGYFVFYGTITGYNFVKYAGVAKLHHRSLTNNLKVIQVFSLLCFGLMCFYAIQLSINTLLFFVPLGVLTLLYAVPFLSGFQKNLRSIGYLKIIVVALVWTGVTVFVPVFDIKIEFTNTLFLVAVQRFFLVVVLILPFDIRDLKYDSISLQTIPRKIGAKRTKILGGVLLGVCWLLEFMFIPSVDFINPFVIFLLLIFILLMQTSESQSKYYSSFLVESMPIVWWMLLI